MAGSGEMKNWASSLGCSDLYRESQARERRQKEAEYPSLTTPWDSDLLGLESLFLKSPPSDSDVQNLDRVSAPDAHENYQVEGWGNFLKILMPAFSTQEILILLVGGWAQVSNFCFVMFFLVLQVISIHSQCWRPLVQLVK